MFEEPHNNGHPSIVFHDVKQKHVFMHGKRQYHTQLLPNELNEAKSSLLIRKCFCWLIKVCVCVAVFVLIHFAVGCLFALVYLTICVCAAFCLLMFAFATMGIHHVRHENPKSAPVAFPSWALIGHISG